MPGFISTPFVEVGGAAADLTHCQEMFWHTALVRVGDFTDFLPVLMFIKNPPCQQIFYWAIVVFGWLTRQGSYLKKIIIMCHTYMGMQI